MSIGSLPARMTLRRKSAAVGYLLKDAAGAARDRIALEIMEIVRQVANGLPAEPSSPLDDGMPSG